MTTESVLCMCFGYVPIFIGGGEGLRVEQRGPVRGVQDHSVSDLLRSQKKWKIAFQFTPLLYTPGTLFISFCTAVLVEADW